MSFRRKRDERGDAMIIWVLGLTMIMLGIGGVSLDTWHAISEQRALAAAADAAAAAGSSGIDLAGYKNTGVLTLDTQLATNLALDNLAAQTGLPGPPDPIVNVTPNRITVTVHGSVNLTLLKIFQGGRPIAMTVTSSSSPHQAQ